MSKLKDLTGQRFGRLTVIKRDENDKRGNVQWLCECDCGKSAIVRGYQLTVGKTKSCGCLKGTHKSHHKSNLRIWYIWQNMKQRCSKESHISYKHYGARGILVCDEWKNDFMNFYNWAMANGYKDNLTIDRIDVNGNYEPNNCRWVNMKTQQRNRTNNHLVTLNGETKCMLEWCEIYHLQYNTVLRRLKNGWDIVTAITKPSRVKKGRL